MKINIFFLESESIDKRQKNEMARLIRKHATIVGKRFGLKTINFTVYPNKSSFVIPEMGVGGISQSKDWIAIYVDPRQIKNIRKYLHVTIYHEMHHLARMKHVGYGASLLEAAVTEGLATVFEEEMDNKHSALYGRYEKQIHKYIRLFKKSMKKGFNHSEWFFGSGKFPRWLGYKIGAYVVRSAKQRTGLTTVDMLKMPAKKIYRLSRI